MTCGSRGHTPCELEYTSVRSTGGAPWPVPRASQANSGWFSTASGGAKIDASGRNLLHMNLRAAFFRDARKKKNEECATAEVTA